MSNEESGGTSAADSPAPQPQFPPHDKPRVWFFSAADTPVGTAVLKAVLAHGDHAVACVTPQHGETDGERQAGVAALLESLKVEQEAVARLKVIPADTRLVADCQSAVAHAIAHFEKIDILFCCNSEALFGTVEEFGQNARTLAALRSQFSTNFFGPVNVIRAVLPTFRRQFHLAQQEASQAQPASPSRARSDTNKGKQPSMSAQQESAAPDNLRASTPPSPSSTTQSESNPTQFAFGATLPADADESSPPPSPTYRAGTHILIASDVAAHLGTPGLGGHCAAQWAIEGYADSLAYEVAPFDVRVSIVQSSVEISILLNRITVVPSMAPYYQSKPSRASLRQDDDDDDEDEDDDDEEMDGNPAPLARGLFASLLDRIERSTKLLHSWQAPLDPTSGQSTLSLIQSPPETMSLFARLPTSMQDSLLRETVHAILAIGGHANPPARHIVGFEGTAAVKEKLRTISEELEEFVSVSLAVDI